MRFFSPQILWLLPAIGLLVLIWYALEKAAAKRLRRFASSELFSTMLQGVDPGRRRLRFGLGALALVFGTLALARPQMGTREETVPTQGLDMVVLLDVSNSMLAEDVVPNRMKKAKHVIKNFASRLSGDRLGVVAFAGSAYPAVPLTTDYDFVLQMLETLDETVIANQGSNLARALDVAVTLLTRGGLTEEGTIESPSEASRVIVVLSDGEAHEGSESTLVDKLKEKGVVVFTIGVGSAKGGPIPVRDLNGYLRGYKKDKSGNMVHTKLESTNLQAIASKTGGKYYMASSNEGEVEEILGRLSSFDRSSGDGRRIIVYEEYYQYPLALAVLCLLLMLYMRETRAKHRGAAEVVALVLMMAWSAQAQAGSSISEYDNTKKGLEAYENKDYAGASQYFGKAQAENPEALTHHMNLGDALLKSGTPEAAIPEFEAVTKSKDTNQAARGAYNLGKAYEAQENFEKALQAYQTGLNRLREDPKSDFEIEQRIKRALEQAQQQKKQQEQQQKNKDGEGQGKPKQDQQEQDEDKKKDKKEPKNYQIPKRKPKFKPEKLSEADAKRILQQLQEQEKQSQQRIMRNKTGKAKGDKNQNDW